MSEETWRSLLIMVLPLLCYFGNSVVLSNFFVIALGIYKQCFIIYEIDWVVVNIKGSKLIFYGPRGIYSLCILIGFSQELW